MNKKIIPIVASLSVIVIFIVVASCFILTEGRQAIITEFGKPVGEPIVNAGLHFKKPFIQEVRFVDKRILSWDGIPNQIPTKDKKYISVDTTARWKIIDVLKFIQTVQNERGAKARLDAILDAVTRDTISGHNLVEAVRNTNNILDKVTQRGSKKESAEREDDVVDDEMSGDLEKIKEGRETLSAKIAERADKELKDFGIKIIDVQFRRISYESSVEKKVFERMISERQRIAQKIRSIGQGEKARIQGRMRKDLQKIESESYKKSKEVLGKGEAISIKIYAKAFSKDPKFYEFVRSMEAYKKSFKKNDNFILSTSSDFMKFLK